MTSFTPDKSKFKDVMGRNLTQSLFLEINYNEETAMYTLADEDKEYNGKVYPSLRRLYIEMADPTEYDFANTYLYNWEHWVRICENKILYEYIEKWQDELAVKLRSKAVRKLLSMDSNFNAVKWAADGHWNKKQGRPSKAEQARERKIRERVVAETASDSDRVAHLIPKKDANG